MSDFEFELLSIEDLDRLVEKEREQMEQAIAAGKTWGNWRFCEKSPPSLHYANSSWWIPLSDVRTSRLLGDLILHLGEKKWISGEDLGNLCQSLRDLGTAGFIAIER